MGTSFRFPIDELLDDGRCYEWLVEYLHPDGLQCPIGHARPDEEAPHTRDRAPIVEYRCRTCGRVYNVFTDTVLNGIRYPCSKIVLILRGFFQGDSTAKLAAELSLDRANLLRLRHEVHAILSDRFPPPSVLLPDHVTEMDEMFQNAGEKGIPHKDPDDPPRRRGNQRPGHGTFANDRPPIVGVVGRDGGEVRMEAVEHTDKATLNDVVSTATRANAVVNTDEWSGYNDLAAMGRTHPTVCHSAREWARDDDGDGVREVHTNTMEGIWTGVRNYLRMFRGVSKWFLPGYVATFAAVYNAVWISPAWLSQALRRSSPNTT